MPATGYEIAGEPAVLVREGGTEFLLPEATPRTSLRGPARRAPVFYNPAMALSRDLHVAVVQRLSQVMGRPLEIWDALAASGIRGLRALKETGGVASLLATDLQPHAVEVLRSNLQRSAPSHVRATAVSADAHEVPPGAPFDLVDLDPYGTPAPFILTAVEALRPGGVVAVTATDMAVLAGAEREACQRRYGARPLRNYLCREAALRIILAEVSRTAARRGRSVHPLLSYERDHHVRAYLRLDALRGDEPSPVRSVPFEGYLGPPLLHGVKGGPLWTGPLHDATFVDGLRPPSEPARPLELASWLERLREESKVDALFYYESGEVGRLLHLTSQPPLESILAELKEGGWKAARTTMEPSGWRTDAPWPEVERCIRRAERRPPPPAGAAHGATEAPAGRATGA